MPLNGEYGLDNIGFCTGIDLTENPREFDYIRLCSNCATAKPATILQSVFMTIDEAARLAGCLVKTAGQALYRIPEWEKMVEEMK